MNLKELFGDRWRVTMEESVKGGGIPPDDLWCYMEIRGKRGMIYPHSKTQLTIYVTGSGKLLGQLRNKYATRPGWQYKRAGEFEAEYFFPVADLDLVAQFIKARKVRRLSPEAKARLLAASAPFKFQPGHGAKSPIPDLGTIFTNQTGKSIGQ